MTRQLLAILTAMTCLFAAHAMDARAGEAVLTCRIEGHDREASVAIDGDSAVYRYGPPGGQAELTLTTPLADLDYRRNSGAGDTIDEVVTFNNGNTAYRVAAGFRDGLAPDPSALVPFGRLTVLRNGKSLARLTCRPDSIRRTHDLLLSRMRAIGREQTSDGEPFPNYPIDPPAPADQSPPCEAQSNVDSCWSRGVAAARGGDLRAALGHYDMSCDAGFNDLGCYEAGKIYLHSRALRDYDRATARLTRVCEGDDPGQGPYACKYLGWMSLTGTGTARDLDRAWDRLAKACFLHNGVITIDPEGCHFLAETIRAVQKTPVPGLPDSDFLAYVALAQGCTDDAETVCDEARTFYATAAARGATWITSCDEIVRARNLFNSCTQMTAAPADYEEMMALRRKLVSVFREELDVE